MTYLVVSNILSWAFTANSPEEAHAKARSSAGKWLYLWKDQNYLGYPETRREIIRILQGKFEVKEAEEWAAQNYKRT
jgi:hypothetical protein